MRSNVRHPPQSLHRACLVACATVGLLWTLGGGTAVAQAPTDTVLLDANHRPVVLWVVGVVSAIELTEPVAPGGVEPATPPAIEVPIVIGGKISEDVSFHFDAGAMLVLLDDGQRLMTLAGPGSVTLTQRLLQPTAGASIKLDPLVGFREIRQPAADVEGSAPGGTPSGLLAISTPRRTAIRERRPRLRWSSNAADGARFDVRVTCQTDGQWDEVELWRGVSSRALTLYKPLPPGASCRLTVALSGASAADETLRSDAAFRVLDVVQGRSVEGGLAALSAITSSVSAPSPAIEVLRARFLAHHGLLEDAERVWTTLASEFPARGELADHVEHLRRR
jgi:hypothetical protein